MCACSSSLLNFLFVFSRSMILARVRGVYHKWLIWHFCFFKWNWFNSQIKCYAVNPNKRGQRSALIVESHLHVVTNTTKLSHLWNAVTPNFLKRLSLMVNFIPKLYSLSQLSSASFSLWIWYEQLTVGWKVLVWHRRSSTVTAELFGNQKYCGVWKSSLLSPQSVAVKGKKGVTGVVFKEGQLWFEDVLSKLWHLPQFQPESGSGSNREHRLF